MAFKEILLNKLKGAAIKAVTFLGWESPDGPGAGWLNQGTSYADKIKYASEIGNPLRTSLIMAAVKWICRTIYEAPMFMVTRDDQGKETNRTTRHHVLSLLKKPNDYYTGMNLFQAVGASWDLDGNAYLLKARDENLKVVELWYEPHYSIRPRWYNDNVFSNNIVPNDGKFISFYEIFRGGRWKRVEVDDVIHLKDGLDPTNPRKGINGISALLAELYTDLQRAHFSATVLGNVGMIPFVVSPRETNQQITEKQAGVLRSELELRAKHKRGVPIVAGKAIRIDELGFSPSDMDLQSMAAIPEERVACVIGPNSYVLGFIPENSVYTNFMEARRDAYESFLIPLQSYIAEKLTEDLLREFVEDENTRLEYDYSNVYAMQEWLAKKMEMWGKAFRDGIATRGHVSSAIGLKMKGKDGYYEDFNAKKEEFDVPNPGKPGPNGPGPSRNIIDNGNERPSNQKNDGPIIQKNKPKR